MSDTQQKTSPQPAPSQPKRHKPRKPRKVGAALPAPVRSAALLVQVMPAQVGMFRFLLEAYDNLAYFTVLEPSLALLKLVFSPHRARAVQYALDEIAASMVIQVQPWPCPLPKRDLPQQALAPKDQNPEGNKA